MDSQDAIKALMVAGKTDDLVEAIDRRATRAENVYAQIRSDTSRTEEYRHQELAAAAVRIRSDFDAELETMARRVITTDRDDAGHVIGVKGLDGDPASLAISRRDAADRVAAAEDTNELRELLRRATRSGDEVLARAVAEHALRNQDSRTMNQYVADRPHLEAAAERLWKAERVNDDAFMVTARLSGLRPSELSGMTRYSIETLAAARGA